MTLYGAVGDGRTLCTTAIQKAVDANAARGGGKVLVPAGKYLSGPIFLRSKLELEISAGATLVANDKIESYPTVESRWEGTDRAVYASLLTGHDLEGVTICGHGTLDGQGRTWWEAEWETERRNNGQWGSSANGPLKYPRPRLINLHRCQNVRISGLTLRNSPSWHLHPVLCDDISLDQLTIFAPDQTPNTDGIDLDSCRNVRVSNCYISTGDDGIAIKSGLKFKEGKQSFPSENIVLTNCVFGTGWAAVAIGSETAGGIRNVTVSNCVCEGTRRGVNLKTARGRGSVVENIRISDFVIRDVEQGILVSMFYYGDADQEKAVAMDETTPTIRDVHFSNISISGAKQAVLVEGLPENHIQGLGLHGLRARDVAQGIHCSHADALMLEDIQINVANGPSVLLASTNDAEVIGFRATVSHGDAPSIRMENSGKTSVQLSTSTNGSRALVELHGPHNRGIFLASNRLMEGAREVVFTDGATDAALVRKS